MSTAGSVSTPGQSPVSSKLSLVSSSHSKTCRETVSCYDHSDCSDRLRCVAGYCGDGEYLEALGEQQCEDHHLCDDLLLGPDCCFDIAGGVEKLASGDLTSPWGKKCCDNIRSPITQPSENLTAELVRKVRLRGRIQPTIKQSLLAAGSENPGAVQSLGLGCRGV